MLTPAFASASYPYPTGTVTLTDEANNTFTANLSGSGDTTFVPITNAPAGTHTYRAAYSGDSKYAAIPSFGSFTVTVNAGSLSPTATVISGVPPVTTFGTAFTAIASVSGSSPSGSVSFLINGATFAVAPISGGSASYTFSLPVGTYSLSAVYNGDASNGGSISSATSVVVGGAATTTMLASSATTGTVGVPISLTATVASASGTPPGTVNFNYTTSTNTTPVLLGHGTLINGVATFSALLPQGNDSVTATYLASGNFASSTSSPAIAITVNAAPPVPVSAAPVALPVAITTIAGGATAANANTTCAGHADSFGNGCQATAMQIPAGTDLRAVAVDPFGNIYFTDSNAQQIRRIATNGVVTNFAGYVTGTACVPTATVGCTPTLVKLSGKPRGVYSDPLGNIYIGGYGDNKVHVVKIADGKMYLVAGTGSAPTNTTDSAGDGGPATAALLKQPRSVATDSSGNIYIADTGDNRIREVLAATGNIQTIVGTGAASSLGDGGLATAATLNNPQGVWVDSSGNVYVAESSRVRAVCVTCTAGTGLYNLLNKLGISAPVNGDIYTIAGTSSSSNSSLTPGLGNAVNMAPQKLFMDPDNNLYITDSTNNVIWFEDFRSGYTRVIAGGGTSTSCSASAIGDGCNGTAAIIGSAGGNGFGLALDHQGNLYIADSTNLRIRKVSNNLQFGATNVGSPVTQAVKLHFVPGDAPSGTNLSSPDFTLAAGACTAIPDTSQDCSYTAGFSPAVPGRRSAPLAVSTTSNNPGYFGLTGTGTGAAANLDPAAQFLFGQNIVANAIATDNAGNVYVADDTSNAVLKFAPGAAGIGAGAAAPSTILGTFTNPSALAVDSIGNVYVADSATGLITQITPAGVSNTLGIGFTSPRGLAVDALNNLYVADASAKTITQVGSNFFGSRVIATGLSSPAGLAVDSASNLYAADTSAGAVYKYASPAFTKTTVATAALAPAAVAVDAAGNVFVADSSSSNIFATPASTSSAGFSVATGVSAHSLALDSAGNLYTGSDSDQILALQRTQAVTAFSRANNAPETVTMLSAGNTPASLTLTDPDQSNFSLTQVATTDCSLAATISANPGGICQFTSQFTPTSATTFTNTATFSGNASNASLATPATLEIVQKGDNSPFPVTLTLQPLSPSAPVYGQSVTFTVSISSDNGNPAGSVVFAVDGTNLAPATVTNGIATATSPSLAAGNHTVVATFTSSDPSFANTTSSPVNFSVSPAAPVVSWPAPAAVIFGSALSSDQLDATASVPGTFTYTPAVGTVLPIGANQTLSVTFTPTDSISYKPVTASTTITVNPVTPALPVNLIVTRILSRSGGNVVATITIANAGTTAVTNVTLTSVKIGANLAAPLPVVVGTINPGATATVAVTVPGSVGAPGAASTLTVSGTYTGGSFGSSARITLP
jgi:sugar lactone lactonase YvrE